MLSIDLQGRSAVVTGGSSGIGLATAALLLQAGANVTLCGRDDARLRAAEAGLLASDPGCASRLLAQRCDVLQAAQVQALADAVARRFGEIGRAHV